jgi:BASS family bile acid:Na+ symporter
MLRTLITVTLVPVAGGMIVRALAPGFAERALEPLRRMVLVLLVVVLSAAALSSYGVIRDNLATAGLLVVLMNAFTMGAGYGVARLARLPAAQAVTIVYEVGVQNLALALLITLTILRSPALAVTALLYAVVMPAAALAFLPVARRIIANEEASPVRVGLPNTG